MHEDLLKEILEDIDIYGFLAAGSYADTYDKCASEIYRQIRKDLSIEQIQTIIWNVFYEQFCICEIAVSKEPWVLDKDQAKPIIGHTDRFRDLAHNIRQLILDY